MAPSFCIDLSAVEQGQLLGIAWQSIESGLDGGIALQLHSEDLASNLSIPLGVFVTLNRFGVLRGCMGSLEAIAPLAQSVANCAFNAAFHDPRFPPLDAADIEPIRIEISVLSEPESIVVTDRVDLLDKLRPGEDGLLLEDRGHRSTFLPRMWDVIGDPEKFLSHLLVKAGLPDDYWSDTIHFKRYQTSSFNE